MADPYRDGKGVRRKARSGEHIITLYLRMDDPEFQQVPAYIAAHFPGLTLPEGLKQLIRDGLRQTAVDPEQTAARRAAYESISREARQGFAAALRELAKVIVANAPGVGGAVIFERAREQS